MHGAVRKPASAIAGLSLLELLAAFVLLSAAASSMLLLHAEMSRIVHAQLQRYGSILVPPGGRD